MGRPRKELSPDCLALLRAVRDAAQGPRSAALVSVADLARTLGCSASKAKYLRRALVDEGLLEVEPRFLPNGGQAESAYRVTRKGRRRLSSAEQ